MANDFYTKTGSPSTGSSGSSAVIRSEYAAIEAGFDKMPLLTSNGNQLVSVNAGGTALESTTAAIARSKIGLAIGNNVQAFNNELTGLSTLNNNGSVGVVVRTGTNNYTTRVLIGTANQVTVANGNGAAGNQTFSLPNPLNIGDVQVNNISSLSSVRALGATQGSNANSAVMDTLGNIARLIGFGASPSQRGSAQIQVRGSDGTNAITALEVAANGAIALNNALTGTAAMLSPLNNSLAANVAMTNVNAFFDGPSVAQGNVGTWFASGKALFSARTNSEGIFVKLWDGTTVIDSAQFLLATANIMYPISLSGYITSPSGNIRISSRNPTATDSNIVFNASGDGKDSTITAVRIG